MLALLLPFVGALLAPLAVRAFGGAAAWVLALLPLGAFAILSRHLGAVSEGQALTAGFDWIPSLGVRFSILIDGLSLTFALLVTGIGALIVLYAGGYLKGHPHLGRFLSFLFLFMGAMLGLVLSDSFLMLFVYWELTSIASFLLIGFDHTRTAARRAALQALVVTGAGGLLLLAGLLVIQAITGVSELSALAAMGSVLRDSPLYLAALLLVLGGAFTKSAQFPFHVWLPNAMEAPTPVSAYLHSATMVKAGVYLLMRLNPVMGQTPEWQMLLPLFGGVTLLAGALMALAETDLKRMLAYTTMASLGLLVLLTGLGTPHAVEAAVLYLVAHSLFKGTLFMVAGIIDHEAGTRDVTRLGGLGRAMPITFVAGGLAALSMMGLPPAFGFLAKEKTYYALTGGGLFVTILLVVVIIGNALMGAVGLLVGVRPFIGAPVKTPKHAHEGPPLLWLGPLLLAVKGVAIAIAAAVTHQMMTTPMASAVAGEARPVTISLLPHLGLPLLLSLVTVALAIAMFLTATRLRAAITSPMDALGWGPDRGFDQMIAGVLRFASALTRRLQPGRLDAYMTAGFVLLAALLLLTPALNGEWPNAPVFPADIPWDELAIFAIALCGLIAVVLAPNRLTAIVSLGIQGFAVAVIFLLYGAPDLAFTQFMIETLSVVILALVMTRLDLSPSDHRPLRQLLPDAALAGLVGFGFTIVLLKVTSVPFDPALSTFFAQFSKTIAHGANIVNVIIVDFRGTDTLGEIAVVMATGLAVLALLRLRGGSERRLADNDPDAAEAVETAPLQGRGV
ncbi:putative monovalent cation/H+ antiporter subunit A [Rhizobium sp. RU20A]|uniref:putative monovalent cation/H+ antiporter subunit A n=1 Tax=Rhizobium sp. RU20A TaxID=1907412 RepID=UPI00122D4711|nr:putative monovalent cation/H+ antiporter subunit A [Rhizobium sp. RU20A]